MDNRRLQLYAELAVRIALNVQPGQRLMIIGPLANGGASLDAAPLAREVAAAAYRAGAPLVETLYGDESQQRVRFTNAPPTLPSEMRSVSVSAKGGLNLPRRNSTAMRLGARGRKRCPKVRTGAMRSNTTGSARWQSKRTAGCA